MTNRDNWNADKRKAHPIARGVLDYFPDALLEVAHLSKVGNDQHNPGQPMHWAKHKSTDEADALMRHLIDRGKVDTDGIRHSAKVAWRALALLQREIEAENDPTSPIKRFDYDDLMYAPKEIAEKQWGPCTHLTPEELARMQNHEPTRDTRISNYEWD